MRSGKLLRGRMHLDSMRLGVRKRKSRGGPERRIRTDGKDHTQKDALEPVRAGSSNHRTKSRQITERNRVKSPNVIDLRLQEVIKYAA